MIEVNALPEEVQEVSGYTINKSGEVLSSRFPVPNGHKRTVIDTSSFGSFLRKLKLKLHGATVKTYSGGVKTEDGIYEAVVDLPIGTKDLHQCADAVTRLRAVYLWQSERYDEIHFNFTNGFRADYSKWMAGNRMMIDGNNTYWKMKAATSNTYQSYW